MFKLLAGNSNSNPYLLSLEAQRKAEAAARREEENKRLSQLDSTRAFAEFLRQRSNYNPPGRDRPYMYVVRTDVC